MQNHIVKNTTMYLKCVKTFISHIMDNRPKGYQVAIM